MRGKLLFGVIAFFVLLLLIGIVSLPFVAFTYLGVSETQARILSSSLASFSTFCLVIVTYLTVRQNQQIVKRQEKELDKERQEDFVDDIILPTKQIVESNKRRMYSDTAVIQWTEENAIVPGYTSDEPDTKQHSLYQICDRKDIDSSEIRSFESEYPEIYERMRNHDEMVEELVDAAGKASREFPKNIAEKLGMEEDGYDLVPNEEDIVDCVLSEATNRKLEYFTLKYGRIERHRDKFISIADTELGEEYNEFLKLKQEYIQSAESLSSELEELRRDISERYRV